MLRLLPASSTTCTESARPAVCVSPPLKGRCLSETEWTRKRMNYVYVGHNSHGPQPHHPKQACNKLKCYELTIINGRQSKPSHTFTYMLEKFVIFLHVNASVIHPSTIALMRNVALSFFNSLSLLYIHMN
jgi:hypothetical protein